MDDALDLSAKASSSRRATNPLSQPDSNNIEGNDKNCLSLTNNYDAQGENANLDYTYPLQQNRFPISGGFDLHDVCESSASESQRIQATSSFTQSSSPTVNSNTVLHAGAINNMPANPVSQLSQNLCSAFTNTHLLEPTALAAAMSTAFYSGLPPQLLATLGQAPIIPSAITGLNNSNHINATNLEMFTNPASTYDSSSLPSPVSTASRTHRHKKDQTDIFPATATSASHANSSNSAQDLKTFEGDTLSTDSVLDNESCFSHGNSVVINSCDLQAKRREQNNLAAKRSRDTRRAKQTQEALRISFLEYENVKLRAELEILQSETNDLHGMLTQP